MGLEFAENPMTPMSDKGPRQVLFTGTRRRSGYSWKSLCWMSGHRTGRTGEREYVICLNLVLDILMMESA